MYFFSAHPLPVLPWLSNRLNNSKSSFEFLYHLGYIILLSPYEQLGNWVWILNGVWVPEFIYWGLVLQRGRREYILINLLKHNAFNILFLLYGYKVWHILLFIYVVLFIDCTSFFKFFPVLMISYDVNYSSSSIVQWYNS